MHRILTCTALLAVALSNASEANAQATPKPNRPSTQHSSQRIVSTPEQIARTQHAAEAEAAAKDLMRQRRWPAAEEKLREAIRLSPLATPPWFRTRLAEARFMQNDAPSALAILQAVYRDHRDWLAGSPHDLVLFAEVAEACRDTALPKTLWKQAAIAGATTNSDLREALSGATTPAKVRALAFVAAGQAAYALGDSDALRDLNRKAIQADPTCALAHLNLGRSGGQTNEALAHFQEAVRHGSLSLKTFAQNEIDSLRYYLKKPAR